MHDQIRDIAKHENFYNLMNYTDHEEYELQRLDSEVKQAKKKILTPDPPTPSWMLELGHSRAPKCPIFGHFLEQKSDERL